MRRQLRLPAVLSVAVLSAVATVGELVGCGGDSPDPDAATTDGASADSRQPDAPGPDAVECINYCFPDGTGTGNECPFPTCATGPAFDVCPEHCSIGI